MPLLRVAQQARCASYAADFATLHSPDTSPSYLVKISALYT